MDLFKHFHIRRWVALLQLMIHILDMAAPCQSPLISCLISHKILQAVWDSSNLVSVSIMGDLPMLELVNGIIWRFSPLLPASTLGGHVLLGVAHSTMACHGVLPDLILWSHTNILYFPFFSISFNQKHLSQNIQRNTYLSIYTHTRTNTKVQILSEMNRGDAMNWSFKLILAFCCRA